MSSPKRRIEIGKILIAVPGPVPDSSSCTGNWVTAERWQGILTELGHQVRVVGAAGAPWPDADLLVALHAGKTFRQIAAFRSRHPDRPIVVTLTGTDLYRDVERFEDARQALRWASRLVVLQPQAFEELGPALAAKARLIRQSTVPIDGAQFGPPHNATDSFDVCVVGHLREVKDPFRAAAAASLLPPDSKIRIVHAGCALLDAMGRRAKTEQEQNPRYRWLGELPRDEALRLLASSRVLAHTSLLEGGANAMSEAFVVGLPVVSSRVGGSVGMLGDDHPAYFEPGDTAALARLLRRCETDSEFLAELAKRSRRLAPLYEPAREVAAWESLLAELRELG